MKTNQIIKITACVSFILIIVALLAIRNAPATGYEISIYAATPLIVWGCLGFSIVCGIGIIVHQIYTKKENNNLWIIGLALILLSNTIILSLHILRGYYLWGAMDDPGTHLGIIQNVITTGHILRSNFYPITHVYVAELSQILDASPRILLSGVPVIFALVYMVFIYFVAKSLLPNKRQAILATVAGTALLHGWYLHLTPNHLASLAFPLVLYLLVRSLGAGMMQWRILFVIIIFLFGPFHPVPALALFIMLAISVPFNSLILFGKNTSKTTYSDFQFSGPIMLLLLVWGITWISSFYVWDTTIHNVHTLITEGGPTALTSQIGGIQEAGQYGYNQVAQFFRLYSGITLYSILALATLPILRRKITTDRSLARLTALYGPLTIIALSIVVLYFLNLGFGPTRLLIYVVLICTFFVGFMLSEFMDRAASHNNWFAKAAPFLIAIILIGVSAHGILKVYPSPYIFVPNRQATQAETEGMDWFLHTRDTGISISPLTIRTERFAQFLLAPAEREQIYSLKQLELPWHFGYDEHSTLGQSYDEDTYVVLQEVDKRLYVDIYPRIAERTFVPDDFAKLQSDRSMDKLYSNGELEVYYAHAAD